MDSKSNESPIFVRGLSRSGGTLLVTILDSHPEVSMSYELYPTLFDAHLDADLLKDVASKLERTSLKRTDIPKSLPAFSKFVARAERGGIDNRQLASLLVEFLHTHSSCDSIESRMGLIAMCCRQKMATEHKQRWGLKCDARYKDYLSVWPEAKFINIVRDGRDVLASQLVTGAFNKTPAHLGHSWSMTHKNFRNLMKEIPDQAFEVRYEDLVQSPEHELSFLTARLNIPFDEAMLRHHKTPHTLFDAHHLSMDEVKQPINTRKIGRWKAEVPPDALADFMREAKDTLIEFGYEV